MNQLVTTAIVLSRTDYGEADRILTLLTPDHGKLRLMAKGVRRIKSKLAGGIELFSVSDITFVQGRSGGIGTLISARLDRHYSHIVATLERTMLGYELIKQLNKITEDQPEPEYFDLLRQAFEALDDVAIALPVVRLWFFAQMLRLGGHTPNLQIDDHGSKLQADQTYNFNFESVAFSAAAAQGRFNADHIKFLRLVFAGHVPSALVKVQGSTHLTNALTSLVATMLQTFLRV